MVDIAENADPPNLDDFSPSDKAKIQEYYSKVKANERKNPDEIDKDYYEIKQRGRPLPCYGNQVVKKNKVLDKPKPRGRPKKAPLQVVTEKEYYTEPIETINKNQDKDTSGKYKDDTYFLYEDIFGKPAGGEQVENTVKSKVNKLEEINKEREERRKELVKQFELRREERRKELDRKKQQQNSIVGKGLKNLLLGKVEQNIISNNNNNMANKWVQYVKEYASKNGISYRDALRDPKCKEGYKKGGAVVKRGKGVVDELGNQDLIAIAYDDSELGANAGKKYISL
jgi:hypothetical protein